MKTPQRATGQRIKPAARPDPTRPALGRNVRIQPTAAAQVGENRGGKGVRLKDGKFLRAEAPQRASAGAFRFAELPQSVLLRADRVIE